VSTIGVTFFSITKEELSVRVVGAEVLLLPAVVIVDRLILLVEAGWHLSYILTYRVMEFD
jgi:hypothetical protein